MKRFKTVLCILFVTSIVVVGIYTQIIRRRLVTISVYDHTYGITIIEIYSNGLCRSFKGGRGFKKERLLGPEDGIEQPKGKIPKEELKALLAILDDMQKYDYLCIGPRYEELGILYKGIEYRTEASVVELMLGEIEEYELNDHTVKLNEFLRKFFSFIPKYLYPDPNNND